MFSFFSQESQAVHVSITVVSCDQFQAWLNTQDTHTKKWVAANNFIGIANSFLLIPDSNAGVKEVIAVVASKSDLSYFGDLAQRLPEGIYEITNASKTEIERAAIAFGMGAYQFTRYKKPKDYRAKLYLASDLNSAFIQDLLTGIYLTRDLINTPAEDMSPLDLANAAKALAKQHHAKFHEIVGEDLIKKNFPAIYAVGKASTREPRFIELNWGEHAHPHVVLVGKGVCFDTGGYNIKDASGMRFMKKDMGGAAHVLGLAHVIMQQKLPIRLSVLIPAVENVIAGNAYKPGDVVSTRKGLSVEIGNTDAEGRVILADALAYGAEQTPKIIIDFATLTGAAKVAMGPTVVAMFSNQREVASQLQQLSFEINDPVWQLPLYQPYRELLNTYIADISNNSISPYGGAITAALFLQSFVNDLPWVHLDPMAWNLCSKPAHPEGGEAMGLQAIYYWLCKHFGLTIMI